MFLVVSNLVGEASPKKGVKKGTTGGPGPFRRDHWGETKGFARGEKLGLGFRGLGEVR